MTVSPYIWAESRGPIAVMPFARERETRSTASAVEFAATSSTFGSASRIQSRH